MSSAARNPSFEAQPPEPNPRRAKTRSKLDSLPRTRTESPTPPTPGHWKPLTGLALAGVAAPFLFVSLTAPAWTGSIGQALCNGLYSELGVAAMLAPFATLGWGLRMLLPKRQRPLQITWAAMLLWLDLDLIAQRMGAQGGSLGQFVDQGLLQTVGPAGSWFVALASLPLCCALVCRTHPMRLVHNLVAQLHLGLGRSHAALERLTAPDESSIWTTPLETPRKIPRQPLTIFDEPAEETPAREFLLRPSARLDVESQGKTGLVGLRARPSEAPERIAAKVSDERPSEHLLAPTSPMQEMIDPQLWVKPDPVRAERPRPQVEAAPVADLAPVAELAPAPAAPSVIREGPAYMNLAPVRPVPVVPIPVVVESPVEKSEEEVFESSSHERTALEVSDEPVESSAETFEEVHSIEDEVGPSVVSAEIQGIMLASVAGEQLRLFPSMMEVPAARYALPPLDLLVEAPPNLARRPIEDKSQILLDALESFGVQAHLLGVTRGPAVTRYELQPARGVKVARFTSLTNDIALALAATAVRIEAPIPGKAAIGIEIPNDQTDLVVLKDILASQKFRKSTGLSIALGKDLQGTPTFANLQKMPHLLVAGTTGSGKSVCVNGLICSLLYRFTPNQLQLLMIDPKQVELSIYEGIPHLIGFAKSATTDSNIHESAIICDPKRAALALHQVVELMEHRYGQFAAARVRNLEEYNEAVEEPLPWVVVIIDELADLMMVASKSVETSICRIAQKARAAGIHLVLATQRPSADVITGLIKVNIPSRIAFAVSSQVDSRVILDTGGAEQLLGKGDMLYCPVDASDPRRIQGCYVTNEEILRVVEFWKNQGSPDNLIALTMADVPDEGASDDDDGDADDQLVEQALEVVLRRQQASASLLQTELKVGYARARRLIYLMEKKGYIGLPEGSKPRKILYTGG